MEEREAKVGEVFMTDNEIIKAWREIKEKNDNLIRECCECSGIWIETRLVKNTFDLLSRQQAEIERLKIRKKEYAFCNLLGNCLVYSENLKDYNKMRIDLKAEAIKEFAGQLKEKTEDYTDWGHPYVLCKDIDNLVKEVTWQDER